MIVYENVDFHTQFFIPQCRSLSPGASRRLWPSALRKGPKGNRLRKGAREPCGAAGKKKRRGCSGHPVFPSYPFLSLLEKEPVP